MKPKKSKRNRIIFVDQYKNRREISLSGDYDDLVIKGFRNIVKRLLHVQRFGGELSRQETNCLESLLPELRKRLIEFDLIEGKTIERVPTIARLIEEYRKTRIDVKDTTKLVDVRHFNYLVEYFGKNKRIDLITSTDAAGLKHYLINERTAGHGKLKSSTANRAITTIKPVFNYAVDCGYLKVSPFAKIKCQ